MGMSNLDGLHPNKNESYQLGYEQGYAEGSLSVTEEILAHKEKEIRAKVLDDVHKAMAYKYHCREDMCEVGMTCADCLKEYMNELYKEQK